MKPLLSILVLLLTVCSLMQAQQPSWTPGWDKKFGGTDEDIITTFQLTPDSGFIVCGTSFSGISGDKTQNNHDTSLTTSDFWIIKTDSSGNILWEKRYGGTGSEVLSDAIVTDDGGIICGGQSFSGISGDKTNDNHDSTLLSNDYWIIKTDQAGIIEWDMRFGGSLYEIFGSICQLPDGGFLISGSSFSGPDGDISEPSRGGWDYWVVRTDATGNKIWDKRFGGSGEDFSNNVMIGADGNYIVAGYSSSGISGDKTEPSRGSSDYWILKIDENGNKLWDKTYGGNYNDWLFALSPAADSGFVVGGQSFSENTGDKTEMNHEPAPAGSDRWIIKLDVNGNKEWDRTVGGNAAEDVGRITLTQDGGYLVSGESYSNTGGDKSEDNLGPEQTWILKIDNTGMVIWDKTIFTYGHDESGTSLPLGDKCFITMNFTQADTGGYKTQSQWGSGDYWMIKLCEDVPLLTQEISDEAGWQCYPNPVSGTVILHNLQAASNVIVTLYDATGKIIFEENNVNVISSGEIHIDATVMKPGFYFCRIIEMGKVYNIRILKAD